MSIERMKRVLAVLLFAAACSRPLASDVARSNAAAAPLTASDDNLREAVLRYMFQHNASGAQQTAHVYCVHFEKKADPPAAFLARFSSSRIPVVAGSRCDESAQAGVVERATKRRGLAFRIDSISFSDANHAEVRGGYFEGGLSASGNVYTLERAGGVWRVTQDQMQWIA